MRAYLLPAVLAIAAFASTGCALRVAGPARHFGYVDGELTPVPPHAPSPRYEHAGTRLAPLAQDAASLGRSLSAAAAARTVSSITVMEPPRADAEATEAKPLAEAEPAPPEPLAAIGTESEPVEPELLAELTAPE